MVWQQVLTMLVLGVTLCSRAVRHEGGVDEEEKGTLEEVGTAAPPSFKGHMFSHKDEDVQVDYSMDRQVPDDELIALIKNAVDPNDLYGESDIDRDSMSQLSWVASSLSTLSRADQQESILNLFGDVGAELAAAQGQQKHHVKIGKIDYDKACSAVRDFVKCSNLAFCVHTSDRGCTTCKKLKPSECINYHRRCTTAGKNNECRMKT
mmetsp:Transcript_2529/g.7593  ORF Transcript_2529/g.7593 Transcript_2529/m.7593 type:complete len:207 (+) Transcript_2529:91-711(+)|eukprot:CAMPEP_0168395716 /NCGR_PEP_ID=MMETSP0228-20121227/20187_1 /TAXON_ID=133427 /ORGANISM="Protoceratium reticulatum, Strain CCCM 535 (=CCMP 1889)" /LENGTH=206 /DNA_ID=CAMNT_0008409157 /DNA_START=80 /DNA_END=700 /DNA_ORIENTATION=-